MCALAINSPLHRFGSARPVLDNASMHKKRRATPLGRLMDAYNGGAGIGDNELSRLTKVPQSTITRIANGTTQDPKEAQLKPLATFFGVSTAHLRGTESPAKAPTAQRVSEPRAGAYSELTPEALHLARTWMQLSPARRAMFHEEMVWTAFFERKFPYYRIGRPAAESYDKLEHSIEANWEKMMRQTKLPLD